MSSARDARFMRMALALGERHLGLTWPNPSVGALVVAGGDEPVIVAQGITQAGGRPHAERLALEAAGAAAKGATLYVSLEPCSHHGRTPPCAEAVVEAGIARLVTGLEDPDPRVRGRGHARVAQAGVAVACGVLAEESRRAHRGHILRVTQGRPAVTVKLARTADGLAAGAGPRLLITGEGANARVHLLRAHADAIMVGIGTVLADDPRLTVRLPGLEDRRPVRVVVDAALRTPPQARLVATARGVPTWILTSHGAPAEREAALSAAGAEVLRVGVGRDGRLDLAEALSVLGDRGLTRILCEGGPTLAEALAERNLVDELVVATSTRPLSGPGLPAIGPVLAAAMRAMRPLSVENAGDDRIEAYERA